MSPRGDEPDSCIAAAWNFLTKNEETVKTLCFVAISVCFVVLTVHNIVLGNQLHNALQERQRKEPPPYKNQDYYDDVLACARLRDYRCSTCATQSTTEDWTNGIEFSTARAVAADRGGTTRSPISNDTAAR